jgi:hypothetical protein
VAKTTIHRLLSRRDVPLREKTLWRMLYETAARAAEMLALNVEDLDLENRRAPVHSKGGATQWVYWDSGTAHLLPRLLRLPDGTSRTHGPLFLAQRRPVPARRPAAGDICPHTGRARLGYDRARVMLDTYASLDLHQLRHSAATHLGDAEVPLQLIMGKTRHKNPRTAMRYVKPSAEAIAKVTEVLAPRRARDGQPYPAGDVLAEVGHHPPVVEAADLLGRQLLDTPDRRCGAIPQGGEIPGERLGRRPRAVVEARPCPGALAAGVVRLTGVDAVLAYRPVPDAERLVGPMTSVRSSYSSSSSAYRAGRSL